MITKTTQDELNRFEQHLLARRNSKGQPECTPRTAREYASAVGRVLLDGGDLVETLRRSAQMGHSSSVASMLRSAGKAWATWKGDDTLRNRLEDIRVTTAHEETQSADFTDWTYIHAALEKLEDPFRSALLLLSISGLRIGDIFMLTYEQASRATRNFEVTILQKGQRPRVWSPSKEERTLLETLITFRWGTVRDIFDHNPSDSSLTEQQHYASAYGHVRKILRIVCRLAGVEYVRPHRHRHTAASFAGHENVDLIDIQKMLGHKMLETTSKFYLHSDAKRQMAEKDKLTEARTALRQNVQKPR